MGDTILAGSQNQGFPVAERHPAQAKRAMDEHGVDILMLQENRAQPSDYRNVQVVVGKSRHPYSSQAILLAPGIDVVKSGSRPAFRNKRGAEIDWRRHVWAVVRDPRLGTRPVTFISSHAPKRDSPAALLRANRRSLRLAVLRHRLRRREVVVAMDGNYVLRRHGDRMGLRALRLLYVAGRRIDHIWTSKGLESSDPCEYPQPNRHDDHPLVTIDLKGARR